PTFDFIPKPLGTRGAVGSSGHGTRDEVDGRAFRGLLGFRRSSRTRSRQLHARSPHPRAWIHRSASAVPRKLGFHVRHRTTSKIRFRPVSGASRRTGSVAHSDGRGSGYEPISGRGDQRRSPSNQLNGLYFVFSKRSWVVRERCARHHSTEPVSEGGVGQVHPTRELLRGVGTSDPRRGECTPKARAALSSSGTLNRRHGFFVSKNLRYRSLASGSEPVSRDFLLLEFRIFPGAAREHPFSQRR